MKGSPGQYPQLPLCLKSLSVSSHVPNSRDREAVDSSEDARPEPAAVSIQDRYPPPLSAAREANMSPHPQSAPYETHLDTRLVLLPDFSTFLLILLCFPFRVFLPILRRRGGDRGLEVAFEPRIEAGVVLRLERGAFWGETRRHRGGTKPRGRSS
jgi:hypothetical protein